MWIEASDGDTRIGQAALVKELFEQQTHADDLFASQFVGNVAQGNVRGDEGDGQFPTGQEHRKIGHAATIGEELGLAGELEANLVHAGFVNWTGDNGVNFAVLSQPGPFFQSLQGGPRRFRSRLA
jgi:hypothetical protein